MPTIHRRLWTALAAATLSVPLATAAVSAVPADAGTRTDPGRGDQTRSTTDPSPDRVTFDTTKAAWATPQTESASPLPGTSTVDFRVVLKLRHQQQAEQAATAASAPGQPGYGQYLDATQFKDRYGATDATVDRLSAYFRGQGMQVVDSDWHAITLRSTASRVERTFQTSLSLHQVDGQQLRAADRALSLPRAYGRSVQTVTGVTQSGVVRQPTTVRPDDPTSTSTASTAAAAPTPPTCSGYWNQNEYTMPKAYGRTSFPTLLCGYVPAQLRTAYGVSALQGGQNGAGTKVAIIDAYGSPTILRDANTYARNRGDAPFARGQFTQHLFKPFRNQTLCGGEAGWNGEETLDVEAVYGMAPGANVLYVGAYDCGAGIDAAQQWIVDHATDIDSSAYGVSIVSNSYSYPGDEPNTIVDPAEVSANHQTLIQAANEGVGYYFSSGDNGDNVAADAELGLSVRPQASYESSDPFATGVGGTSLAVGSVGNYLFETGWGSSADPVTYDRAGNQTGYGQQLPGTFIFGAGGGVSTQFAQPGYQAGTVPDSLSQKYGAAKMRVAPDVSMVGDPYTGFLIGQTVGGTYSESSIGGTSLSTPLFAAMQAIVQGTGPRIGFANQLLYGLGSTAFHDVVPPSQVQAVASRSGANLITLDQDTSLTTSGGYDDVTGRGTPNGATFVRLEQDALR